MKRKLVLTVVQHRKRNLFYAAQEGIMFDRLDALDSFCYGSLTINRGDQVIGQTVQIEWRGGLGGMENSFHLCVFDGNALPHETQPSELWAKDYQIGDILTLEFNSSVFALGEVLSTLTGLRRDDIPVFVSDWGT